jgi:hypothetical protein
MFNAQMLLKRVRENKVFCRSKTAKHWNDTSTKARLACIVSANRCMHYAIAYYLISTVYAISRRI